MLLPPATKIEVCSPSSARARPPSTVIHERDILKLPKRLFVLLGLQYSYGYYVKVGMVELVWLAMKLRNVLPRGNPTLVVAAHLYGIF